MNENEQKQQGSGFGKSTRQTARTVTITRKQLLIGAIVVVAVFAGLVVWKTIQLNSLKKEYNQRQAALKTQLKALYVQQSSDFLHRLAKPYVWALRTEMLQGNNNQVNLYNNEMVKEKNVQSVMVTDNKGIIISSTDKKFEGKSFLSVHSGNYLNTDSTVVNTANDSLLVLASPIMGFNSRLGTLIINYSVKTPAILQ